MPVQCRSGPPGAVTTAGRQPYLRSIPLPVILNTHVAQRGYSSIVPTMKFTNAKGSTYLYSPATCTLEPTLDGMLTFGTPTLDEWQVFDAELKPSKAMTYAYVKLFRMEKDEAGARRVPLPIALWVDQSSYRRLLDAVSL